MLKQLRRIHEEEEGHALPFGGALVGSVGLVMVGVGAASGTDWLCVVGGIAGGFGILAANFLHHAAVDADIYGRLEKLEAKSNQD